VFCASILSRDQPVTNDSLSKDILTGIFRIDFHAVAGVGFYRVLLLLPTLQICPLIVPAAAPSHAPAVEPGTLPEAPLQVHIETAHVREYQIAAATAATENFRSDIITNQLPGCADSSVKSDSTVAALLLEAARAVVTTRRAVRTIPSTWNSVSSSTGGNHGSNKATACDCCKKRRRALHPSLHRKCASGGSEWTYQESSMPKMQESGQEMPPFPLASTTARLLRD
jgi:hypothetical protein